MELADFFVLRGVGNIPSGNGPFELMRRVLASFQVVFLSKKVIRWVIIVQSGEFEVADSFLLSWRTENDDIYWPDEMVVSFYEYVLWKTLGRDCNILVLITVLCYVESLLCLASLLLEISLS